MPPLPGSDDKAEEFDLLPTAPRQNYSRLGWAVPLITVNSACATFTIAPLVLLLILCSIGVLVLLGMTSATLVILRVAACIMYQCCSPT